MEARTCRLWSVLGNKPAGLQTCTGEHCEHPPLSLPCSWLPSKRGGGPSVGKTGEEGEVGGSPRETSFTSQPRLSREQCPSHWRGTASPLGSSLLQPERGEGPGWHSSQLSVVHRWGLTLCGTPTWPASHASCWGQEVQSQRQQPSPSWRWSKNRLQRDHQILQPVEGTGGQPVQSQPQEQASGPRCIPYHLSRCLSGCPAGLSCLLLELPAPVCIRHRV